jgi:hypothetical protein
MIFFGMNMMRWRGLIMRYFPMRPPIVNLGLLCDNRTQEMGGTIVDSKKDKERTTIV